MENIGYEKKDINEEAYKLMKKLMIREKLHELCGQEVTIYIDRPIGSIHPNNNDIIYKVNYGYIKEITALDNEYQDAYLLGVDEPVKMHRGKIIALIEREDDIEDKLVISVGKTYTIDEIKELVDFQEKFFKTNIILL